jgi:transposase-like protein
MCLSTQFVSWLALANMTSLAVAHELAITTAHEKSLAIISGCGAAKRELLPGVEHRQHRYLNNCAENSHQPTRQCERRMQAFKSPGQAHRFLATYGPMAWHFRPRCHRFTAQAYRQEMVHRFQIWQEIIGTAAA